MWVINSLELLLGGVVGIVLAPIFTQDGVWFSGACSTDSTPCDFKPYYANGRK